MQNVKFIIWVKEYDAWNFEAWKIEGTNESMSTLKIHNFHIHILYKLASNRNTELKEVTKFETAERIYEYQATTSKSK